MQTPQSERDDQPLGDQKSIPNSRLNVDRRRHQLHYRPARQIFLMTLSGNRRVPAPHERFRAYVVVGGHPGKHGRGHEWPARKLATLTARSAARSAAMVVVARVGVATPDVWPHLSLAVPASVAQQAAHQSTHPGDHRPSHRPTVLNAVWTGPASCEEEV
jgi:hypothetical protein